MHTDGVQNDNLVSCVDYQSQSVEFVLSCVNIVARKLIIELPLHLP